VLVVDTGALVATVGRADKDHAACRAFLEGDAGLAGSADHGFRLMTSPRKPSIQGGISVLP
jgi:hypothetical protein